MTTTAATAVPIDSAAHAAGGSTAAAAAPTRFRALDVFRGATVALMIVVNNPGSWSALFPPLAHATWHGCTPTDLVFPFFLFAVGNALAFTMPGLQQATAAHFTRKLLQRTLLIFGIGLLLNAAPFVRWDAQGDLVARDWTSLRLMGVLQRIALAWCLAVLLLRFSRGRAVLAWVAALLLAYWAACVAFGTPGDAYSLNGWFGTAWDARLLGSSHLYRGEGLPFDPEGLASTVPAVAQVLLGYWIGEQLRRAPPNPAAVMQLFLAAVALGLLAYAWQLLMPINKKIWTGSYVLLTTGLAIASLASLVALIDLRGPRSKDGQHGRRGEGGPVLVFCEVFGKNALFVYAMSGLIPRLQGLLRWPDGLAAEGQPRWITPMDWAWRALFQPLAADARIGSLLFALANLAGYWALAWWLDRQRLYLKV